MPIEGRTIITGFALENYRAFGRRTFIPCAPITLLFGKNSVGKTAALSALQLLSQSYLGPRGGSVLKSDLPNSLTRLGSPRDYFHRHDWNQPLRIGVSMRERGVEYELEWTFRAESDRGGVDVSSLYAKCSRGFAFTFVRPRLPPKQVPHGPHSHAARDAANTFSADRRKSRVSQEAMNRMAIELVRDSRVLRDMSRGLPAHILSDPALLKKALRADQLRANLVVDGLRVSTFDRGLRTQPRITELAPDEVCSTFLQSAEGQLTFFDVETDVFHATLLCERIMSSLRSVGPVREIPRYLDQPRTATDAACPNLQIPALLTENESLLRQANEWLRRLEIPYELITRTFSLVERLSTSTQAASALYPDIRELRLRDLRRRGVEVGFTDVGFGISQILPVVCQLLLTRNAVITVEQPELHVHPALQAEMGELFVYSAQVLRNQLIVETHSEHLALRLQRCVRHRRDGITPDTVSIVYLDTLDDGTTAQHLPLGTAGELKVAPPQGWFLERLHELMPKGA